MVANATGTEPTWQGEDSEGRRERWAQDNRGRWMPPPCEDVFERASVENAVLTPPALFFFLPPWCEAEVGTWHTRGWHTLSFNPHHRIPIALSSCHDVRALLRATCAGLVCALPLGLIAPAPLHKPLVHDDFNLKCVFAPIYMFPLSCPPCFLWVSCGIWVVIPSVYAGCNKYGVKLEVIPRLWRLLSSLWWTPPCMLHRLLY